MFLHHFYNPVTAFLPPRPPLQPLSSPPVLSRTALDATTTTIKIPPHLSPSHVFSKTPQKPFPSSVEEDPAWSYWGDQPPQMSTEEFISSLLGPLTLQRIQSKWPQVLEASSHEVWERIRAIPHTLQGEDKSLNVTLSIVRREVGILTFDERALEARVEQVAGRMQEIVAGVDERLVIQRVPSLLLLDVEKQVKPNIAKLRERLPLFADEFWRIVQANPLILLDDFDTDIQPRIQAIARVSWAAAHGKGGG